MKILPAIQDKPVLVIIAGTTAMLILAFFSVGWYHPDEHFQILEFAGWKLGQTSPASLPWELYYQIRPAFQPALAAGLSKILSLSGIRDPFLTAMILRLMSATISVTAMVLLWKVFRDQFSGYPAKWFLWLSFFTWFALCNHVRFTSETWSGCLFAISLALLYHNKDKKWKSRMLISGLIAGLAFVCRFQAGLMIGGWLLWMIFIRKEKFQNLLFFGLGFILTVIAGSMIDRWFYGEWTLTLWNYFDQNILQNRLTDFGTSPVWFYFTDVFIRAVPPFSLVIILSFLVVFIFMRKDILTWTLLPFVAFHFLIPHKETRFLYPLIWFVPVIIIKSLQWISQKKPIEVGKYKRPAELTFLILNFTMLLAVCLNPADGQVHLYREIYQKYPEGITMYFTNENPYQRALEISWYKRDNLNIKPVSEFDKKENNRYLLVSRNQELVKKNPENQKLVFSSLPRWVKSFNINHWVERTSIWYVYEAEKGK